MTWVAPLGRFIDGQKKRAPETAKSRVLRWGQLRHARCAYDVVSFLPTQTSSTRLVVFGEIEKPSEDFSRAGLAGIENRTGCIGLLSQPH